MNYFLFVIRFYFGLKILDLDFCGNDFKDFDFRDDDIMQMFISFISKLGFDCLFLEDSDDEVFDFSIDDEFCDSIIVKS